jgi:hypothetical protein
MVRLLDRYTPGDMPVALGIAVSLMGFAISMRSGAGRQASVSG